MKKKKKRTIPADTESDETVIELDEALGLAVRRIREHQGMTQTRLAEKAGVSQAWISLAERAGETNKNKRPSLGILQRIASALGLPGLSDLIRCAEKMTEVPETLADVDQFIAGAKQ